MESYIKTVSLIAILTLFVDFLLGFIFRPKISIQRYSPTRVRAGTNFKIKYVIKNLRSVSAFNLIFDPLNFTYFIKTTQFAQLNELISKDELVIESQISALKRGVCIQYSPRVESAFPFGIMKWNYKKKAARTKLIVTPKFYPLESLELTNASQQYSINVNTLHRNAGVSDEYIGNREFRTGDDFRHIHWRASARNAEIIIRDFAKHTNQTLTIWLDTIDFFSNRKNDKVLESALSLISAIAHFVPQQNIDIPFFVHNKTIYPLKDNNFVDHLDEQLSSIELNKAMAKKSTIAAIGGEIPVAQSAIIIGLKESNQLQQEAQTLMARGFNLKVILLTKPKEKLPLQWIYINPVDIDNGRIIAV